MFPKNWNAAKIQAEIDSAWLNQKPNANPNKWTGISSSGVEIEGYLEPRTTAYPVYNGGKK